MTDSKPGIRLGIPKEVFPGERRVALAPASLNSLTKLGATAVIESGAGVAAGFPDEMYRQAGATVVDDLFAGDAPPQVVAMVRAAGAAGAEFSAFQNRLPAATTLVASCDPLSEPDGTARLAQQGVTAFSLELIPRITRAQSMDVLSSMATIAGYKAVLLAAERLPRMFPMLMTAAGTITPAKVLIVGAGVAGLQAIATARRLGAVVYSYDVRPAVKEQVQSLGARFVELELETSEAEQAGGYAKELTADQLARQQQLMADVVADSDVVITTAAVPGRKAPVIVTTEMVDRMRPGSVIVDLAAERGGNCALCQPGTDVEYQGVTIMGPLNVPSSIPIHASEMYSRNVVTFLGLLIKDGQLSPDLEDEILRETLICRDGQVQHAGVRELLQLPSTAAAEPADLAQSEPAGDEGDSAAGDADHNSGS